MKIKSEHFEYLSLVIAERDTEELRERYKEAGLSDKRYRWDLVYRCGLTTYICDVLYSYMDDSHIDTALKRIVTTL